MIVEKNRCELSRPCTGTTKVPSCITMPQPGAGASKYQPGSLSIRVKLTGRHHVFPSAERQRVPITESWPASTPEPEASKGSVYGTQQTSGWPLSTFHEVSNEIENKMRTRQTPPLRDPDPATARLESISAWRSPLLAILHPKPNSFYEC